MYAEHKTNVQASTVDEAQAQARDFHNQCQNQKRNSNSCHCRCLQLRERHNSHSPAANSNNSSVRNDGRKKPPFTGTDPIITVAVSAVAGKENILVIMAKSVLMWTLAAFAVVTLLLMLLLMDGGGAGKHSKSNHGASSYRRGGPGRRIIVKVNSSSTKVPFDPIVAKLEQRREDKDWESEQIKHKAADYGLNGSEWQWQHNEEHHGDDEDDDFLNDEDRFNITDRLVSLFPLVDVNPRDGFITLSELLKWHVDIAESRLLHRTHREMESHDQNRDGLITLKEYLSHLNEEELDNNSTDHGDPGWWREQYNCADENGDGYLNFTEFHNFLHPEESTNTKLLLWLCKERIKERDTDKDGKISVLEFEHGVYDLLKHFDEYEPTTRNSSGYPLSPEERFAMLDKNNDGFLTADEFLPVLPSIYPGEKSYAKYQAQYLIHQADENKDGKLSLEEMLVNPYTFYNTAYDDEYEDDDYVHDEFR